MITKKAAFAEVRLLVTNGPRRHGANNHHRPDYVVDSHVVVEIKSVARYDPVFATQVLTYMRLTDSRVGLLLNFNRPLMKDEIKRFVP